MYIINFCILLIVFIKFIADKETSTEYLFGAYFWVINLIEVIIVIANLKRINKKNILIIMTILLVVQIAVIFCVPAYREHFKFITDEYGVPMPNPTVEPSAVNAYGTNTPF